MTMGGGSRLAEMVWDSITTITITVTMATTIEAATGIAIITTRVTTETLITIVRTIPEGTVTTSPTILRDGITRAV